MARAIDEVVSSCHQCTSLRASPLITVPQSSEEPSNSLDLRIAADVIKRHQQLVYVSFCTATLLIPDEQKETLREAILKTYLPIKLIRDPPAVVRIDSAPGFKSLENDEFLLSHHISIEVGDPKNPNNNPVAEKAVQDIEREVKVDPTGPQVSSASLAITCCALNCGLASLGLSPREVLYHRDQFSDEHVHFDDNDLIDQQHRRRTSNHPSSERSKAPNCSRRPHTEVGVGDIVYLHRDLKKTMAVKGTWCHSKRTIGSMSGSLLALS